MNLPIYRGDTNNVVAQMPINERDLFTHSIMSDHYIKFNNLVKTDPLDVQIDDFILIGNIRYTINFIPDLTVDHLLNYSLTFEAPEYGLFDKMVIHEGEADFPYYGTASDQLELILDNVAQIKTGYVMGVVEPTAEMFVDYQNYSARVAITKVAEKFGLEYSFTGVDGKTINLVKTVGRDTNLVFEYGINNGLYSLSRNYIAEKNVKTRVYGFGGTRNLPKGYRNNSKRLTFTGLYKEKNTQFYGVKETYYTNEEIYPKREGVISAAGAVTDDSQSFTITDNSIDFDFNDYRLSSDPKISFLSGELMGEDFDVTKYNHATKTFTLKSKNNSSNIKIPTANFKAEVGNKYAVYDIGLPASYVTEAENDLEAETLIFTEENAVPQVELGLNFDILYLKENNVKLEPGDRVTVLNGPLGINAVIRITSVSYPITFPAILTEETKYTAVLSNTITYSQQDRLTAAVINNRSQIAAVDRRGVETAQRNAFNLRLLENSVFDTDGMFDTDKFNVGVLSAALGIFGVKSQNFILNKVILTDNYLGNPNAVFISNGELIHLEISNPGNANVWQMQSITKNDLIGANFYYVYARCSKNSQIGTFLITQDQLKYDSEDNYYTFLAGVIYPINGSFRDSEFTNGITDINGARIKTGIIQGRTGNLIINLETGEIQGKLTFVSSNGSTLPVSGIADTANAAQASANTANTKIDGLQIGGRNFIRNSRGKFETSDYLAVFFMPFSQPLIVGETYILSYKQGGGNINITLSTSASDAFANRTNIPINYPFVATHAFASIMGYNETQGLYVSAEFLKLERGNKATDWTPAPEDAVDAAQLAADNAKNAAIAASKVYADAQAAYESELAKAYADGIVTAEEQARIDQAATNLQIAKDDSAAKAAAAQAAASALANAAQGTADAATAAAAAAAANLVNLKNSLGGLAYDNAVSLAKLDNTIIEGGYIKSNLIEVSTLIVSGDLETKTGAQNKANTAKDAAQAAAAIDATSKANNAQTNAILAAANNVTEKLNSLKFGGRNYLLNTASQMTLVGYQGSGYGLTQNLILGETYTVSLKGKNISNGPVLHAYVSAGVGSDIRQMVGVFDNSLTDNVFTFIVNSNGAASTVLTLYNEVAGIPGNPSITIYDAKLEKGNKATDWTPAPEDISIDATNKANAAQAAAILASNNYASSQDNLKAVEAAAYADGKVTAEEQARINQAAANLQIAKDDAQIKATNAENAAKLAAALDAQIKAENARTAAESAAKSYADAQDILNKTQVQAYADGIVTAEEQARIDQAAANLQIAKNDAQAKADAAKNAAIASAEADATAKLNGIKIGGRNFLRNSRGKFENSTYNAVFVLPFTQPLTVGETYILNYKQDGGPINVTFSTVYGDNFANRTPIPVNVPFIATYPFVQTMGYNEVQGLYVSAEFLKLEKGNKATDWTPAPEEVTEAAQAAADTAQASAKSYADAQDVLRKTEAAAYADGKVTAEEQRAINDANAKLQIAKDDATAKANAAEIAAKNAAAADAGAKADAAKVAAENAAKAYADAQDVLRKTEAAAYADGKVSAEEQARINQAAANLQAAKDDSAAKAAAAQAAAISAAAADAAAKLNALTLGGRNYLKNTITELKFLGYSGSGYALSQYLTEGETYTLTVNIKNVTGGNLHAYLSQGVGGPNRQFLGVIDNSKPKNIFTFVVDAAGATDWVLTLYNEVAGIPGNPGIDAYNVKLEKGNKPTDWTQAPEDILESAQTAANGYTEQRVLDVIAHSNAYANAAAESRANAAQANAISQAADTAQAKANAAQAAAETLAQQLVNNIKVGGRNYLRNSRGKFETTSYAPLVILPLAIPLVAGEVYIFSYKGMGETPINWTVGTGDAYNQRVGLPVGVPWVAPYNSNILMGYNETQGVYVYAEFLKIEKGTKATDWAPAPEDVTEAINTAQTAATNAQNAYNALTGQLKGMAYVDVVELAKLGNTVIQGGKLTNTLIDTEFLKANVINAGYIQSLEIVSKSIRTANAGTKRVEITQETNNIRVYDASNNVLIEIDDDSAFERFTIQPNDPPNPPTITQVYGPGIRVGTVYDPGYYGFASMGRTGFTTDSNIVVYKKNTTNAVVNINSDNETALFNMLFEAKSYAIRNSDGSTTNGWSGYIVFYRNSNNQTFFYVNGDGSGGLLGTRCKITFKNGIIINVESY